MDICNGIELLPMKETRKRGIRATKEGQQKLRSAKAAKRNHNNKIWTYLDIATAAEVNETTVKRFFGGKDNVDRESALSIVKALNLDITEIVDPNEWNTLTIAPTDIEWRDICDKVLETQQLRRQATAQQYELNIYVPLGLMERPKTPNPRINPTGEESQPQKEPELQIVQTYKDDAFFQKVIAENRTDKAKHIAIIGEPGAGKTTLLGKLAERLPKNSPDVPICIRLADLRESTIADYLLNNWLQKALPYIDADAEDVTPEIKKALKQLFAEGKVWLLLDGVDEMAVASPVLALAKIRDQLTDWVGKARVVLTCRLNVWDATISNTLTNFDTYKSLEFEPDDVDEFICQWFEQASQDEKRRNSGNETFWLEQGKRLQQQLKAPGKERIRELVRNPLRLSMLCQSWCVPERDLPETKAALYEQFTTCFFEWKKEEFQKKNRVLKETDKKQIQQALAKLALAAMESVNRFQIDRDFAIEQMEEEWFKLADELGWLVLVDRDTRTKKPVYAFYHPTFQEYFAACAVEDWHFFLNHQIPPVSSDCYRIFERQWREVILLWLGRGEVERKQKQEFIDALVNFEDGCGEWQNQDRVDKGCYEYRAYFLAAAAIAEFQNYSQIDKVIGQIVRWGFDYFDTEEQEWVNFFYAISDVISDAAREALQQTQRPKAIDVLMQLLSSRNLARGIRSEVAESLGNTGQGNQKAIDALVQLLSSPNLARGIHRQVAESLGKIAQGNQKAIDALVPLLNSPNLDNDTHRQVAESLGKIGQGNQKAIDALVPLLNSPNLDVSTRWQVAESLGKIGQGNQKAIDALVQLLSSGKLVVYIIGQGVPEILGKIGQGNQKAINALVQLLSSPNLNRSTRSKVAESLGMIGQGNQKAIAALMQLLSSPDLDYDTRREVAESLGDIDPGNQKAIDALVPLLSSPKLVYIRGEVPKSLGMIGQGNQKAIDALVQLLSSPNLNGSTRSEVAESLGMIGQGNQKAIDALVQLLSSPNLDNHTRSEVLKSLEKIGQGNQKAINALVQQLNSPNLGVYISWQVAVSLGNIDPGNQKAIDALVQLLIWFPVDSELYSLMLLFEEYLTYHTDATGIDMSSSNLDDVTCSQVAESLGKIGQGNQKAINALVQLLSSPNLDDDTYSQVVQSLENIGQGNQNVIDALVQQLNSPNFDVSTHRQVVGSLGKIGQGNQKAIDALVQQLNPPNLDVSTHRQVAASLGKIGQGDQNAIDALVPLLNSPNLDDDTRWQVVESLGKIDPGNQKTIDALVQLLTSPNLYDYTREQVAVSLGQIDPGNQKTIDALMQLLSSPNLDNDTRGQVLNNLGKIDPGNQKAIDALVQQLNSPNLDDDTRWQVAFGLGYIDLGNQKAIDHLVSLLSSPNLDDDTRWQVAFGLGYIDPGNQKAIAHLVSLLSSPNLDDKIRRFVPEILKKIPTDKQFAVITALKANFNNSQQIDDEECYKLIWHYAQNLPYPDFYQAWHQDTLTNPATASLNLANLPQLLAEAINNKPDLCSKVKLICIDTHQFIEPENPAPEIYDQMLDRDCPEWQNGYPDTMQKLKLYWNSLHRQSEIPLFFICYDSTALSATPTGFSAPFLKALSKFDRAICIVCETEDIPLQTFSPSQPNLIEAIVKWIKAQ